MELFVFFIFLSWRFLTTASTQIQEKLPQRIVPFLTPVKHLCNDSLNWMKWLIIQNGCWTGAAVIVAALKPWQPLVLTSDTRLTRIRGAGVPGWVLLQHSVGHQTTWHQCRRSIVFNPFQTSSYPLFPAKNKVSSKNGGFTLLNTGRTSLVFMLKYLFIPKSCLTASSNTFFNSETENENIIFDIYNKQWNKNDCASSSHLWGGPPDVWHLCLKHSWPTWSSHPEKCRSGNWKTKDEFQTYRNESKSY